MAERPPILLQGDTIGIVTLGSPLERAKIDQGISILRQMGFNIVLGDYVYSEEGYLSSSDEQRAGDLMKMFADPDVKMILPSRGGVGVAGILPYLDYAVIRQNPKILSGYSDITVLQNVLLQYTGLITFQSLLLLDFTPETPAYNFEQFFAAVATLQSPRRIANPPGIPQVSRVPGNVTGQTVGGNITSFDDTIGTIYDIDTAGKIIFLEEIEEPVNKVYRYVNHLKLAGKFEECAGIVLGECTKCGEAYGKTFEDLITDFFIPLGKPLMTNVTTAHGTYKAAIPIGTRANLNTENNTFTILEPGVKPVS
ncbi:LD-carboxypeptidase [Bacillus mangrovi]|uniref:LD-carboxypeptidase n=1 Tax=Metabacillus mangrovi TaxID=1491830 RepID=A0A7X2V5W0_9BACI|nr:LD-carboxypeptidase [Metabacillus mangrovi]MTH54599.1 LD-carboxypeptidase [Metabacillus mangrovi]